MFPEKVRVDLIRDGSKMQRDGAIAIRLVRHGLWEIDKETGKSICLIELQIPSEHLSLNFPTTQEFLTHFVNEMMKAEFDNDNFMFNNPVKGKHRPPELLGKARKIEKVIQLWKSRAKPPQGGLL